jgi:hypothetical protein
LLLSNQQIINIARKFAPLSRFAACSMVCKQ